MEFEIGRRQLKQKVLCLLQKCDLAEIFQQLDNYPAHKLINPLFIALCHSDEIVKWRAVCSFGRIIPAIADKNPEAARVVMRRFLWSLNDESGGIGWGVPEAMAEIMCHSAMLRQEYLHMLISYLREDGEDLFQDGNYLELPLMQRGLLWGVGRLCQEHRQEMIEQRIVDDLSAYLESPDLQVRGMAIRCLALLATETALGSIRRFRNCTEELHIFLDEAVREIRISTLVQSGLELQQHDR